MQRPGSNAPSIRCRLKNWWDNPGVKKIIDESFGDREGSHATASEVSVTQFAYPDIVKRKDLAPIGPKLRDFADADDYRRLFPDGRIGSDPTLATPEHGRRLVAAAVNDLKEDYRRFLTQA
jgi:creatinine amidohydrolase